VTVVRTEHPQIAADRYALRIGERAGRVGAEAEKLMRAILAGRSYGVEAEAAVVNLLYWTKEAAREARAFRRRFHGNKRASFRR